MLNTQHKQKVARPCFIKQVQNFWNFELINCSNGAVRTAYCKRNCCFIVLAPLYKLSLQVYLIKQRKTDSNCTPPTVTFTNWNVHVTFLTASQLKRQAPISKIMTLTDVNNFNSFILLQKRQYHSNIFQFLGPEVGPLVYFPEFFPWQNLH